MVIVEARTYISPYAFYWKGHFDTVYPVGKCEWLTLPLFLSTKPLFQFLMGLPSGLVQ